MYGAGETKNIGIRLVGRDAEAVPSYADVRLYWKNGMLWTVYRGAHHQHRGLKLVFARVTLRFRHLRARMISFLMKPWP